MSKQDHLAIGTVCAVTAVCLSGWAPYDRLTWFLEVAPILIVFPILWGTRRRFPLTPLLYRLIALHAIVLAVGGCYTYARVPLGDWIAELFALHRNPYDKVGHFFQGLVPALAAREILCRGGFMRGGAMRIWTILSMVLAISALYELVEWAAALGLGQGADEFLGTQGDPWDTQSDMFFALLGGISALVFFSRQQDRQLSVGGWHERTP